MAIHGQIGFSGYSSIIDLGPMDNLTPPPATSINAMTNMPEPTQEAALTRPFDISGLNLG